MEREKIQKRREDILKSPTKLYKYRNEFTKQEIDDAMKRFDWEKKLSEYSVYEMNAGKRYVDGLIGYAKTGLDAYNTATNIYDAVQKVKKKKRQGGN